MNTVAQYLTMLDLMLEGVQVLDYNWRYLYVNEAVLQHSRYSREELMGHTLLEKYPGFEQSELFQTLQHCMTNRVSEKLQSEFPFADGSIGYFDLRVQPVPEGIAIFSIERTDFKRAEEKFLKASRLYAFISAINQSIVHTTSEKVLLNNACRVAIEIGNFKMAWINCVDEAGILSLASVHGPGDMTSLVRGYSGINVYDERVRHTPTGRVYSTGHYVVSNAARTDGELESWKQMFIQTGTRSLLIFPIKKFGKVIGSFGFLSTVENFFDETELSLLTEAVGDISFALENFDRAQKHQETEELVLKNERRFRGLIEKSADMKTLTNFEGRYVYASPAVTANLGYTPEEISQLTIRELVHPEDHESFMKGYREIAQVPGASLQFRHRRRHKNGTYIWCEGSVTNLLHEPGVRAMVTNCVDISEKIQAEQEREFSQNNLHALINNTHDLMWSVDRHYNLITSNKPFQAWLTKIGSSPVQIGGHLFSDSLPEAIRQQYKAAYDRTFAGESFTKTEYRQSPEEYWLEISYTPIWENNRVIGAACHARNITENKRAEARLHQTVRELIDYKYALDVSAVTSLTDKRGVITFVNQNFCVRAQHQQDELIGQTHRVVNSGYHTAEFFENLWATIGKGKVWKGELKNRRKDGTHFWVATTIVPFLDMHKQPYQYMAIQQDITERKETEEVLIAKNRELEKTNTELDRFVYSASHDLRSPLASVLGLLHFIEIESTEQQILDYARMIRESINRLDGFIKNILNYSRNNRTELEITHVPVQNTVTEIVTMLGQGKQAAHIRFEVAVTEREPFYTDVQRFAIVLENLVSNAIKFADERKEESLIRISGETSAAELVLRVHDNGIGIPELYLPKIFNMFYRIESKRAGSGIGLYIVKETLEVLGGSITVRSTEKESTTFTVTFKNYAPSSGEQYNAAH